MAYCKKCGAAYLTEHGHSCAQAGPLPSQDAAKGATEALASVRWKTVQPAITDAQVAELVADLRAEHREVEERRGDGPSLYGDAADALESLLTERNHWREARRAALQAGDILKEQLDTMRRELNEVRAEREALRTTATALLDVLGELVNIEVPLPLAMRFTGACVALRLALASNNEKEQP